LTITALLVYFFQMKPDVEAYFLDVGDLLKKQQRQLIQVTEALVATDVVSLSSWHSTVQQYVTMFTFTSHSVQAGGVGLPVFRRTCSMLFVCRPTSRYQSTRSTSSLLSTDIAVAVPLTHLHTDADHAASRDMKLPSARSHIVKNTTNILIQTKDLFSVSSPDA